MEIQNYFYDLPDDLQDKINKYVYDGCMKQIRESNLIKLYTLYDIIKVSDVDFCIDGGINDYINNIAELENIKYICIGLPIINNKEFYKIINRTIHSIRCISAHELECRRIRKIVYLNNNINIYFKDPMRCNADGVINIINSYSIVKHIFETNYMFNDDCPYKELVMNIIDWLENHRFLEGWNIGKIRKNRIEPFFGS
jgi:hypothetical protein